MEIRFQKKKEQMSEDVKSEVKKEENVLQRMKMKRMNSFHQNLAIKEAPLML